MFGIDDIVGSVLGIVNKIIPDPELAAKVAQAVMDRKQAGEFKQMDNELQELQMQADINKTEAASTNWFVAGWRPMAGWSCDAGLAYAFLIQPLLMACGVHAPVLDTGTLIGLLTGMLGVHVNRTVEKIRGVAR